MHYCIMRQSYAHIGNLYADKHLSPARAKTPLTIRLEHQSAYFNAIILYIAAYFTNFARQDQGISLSYHY